MLRKILRLQSDLRLQSYLRLQSEQSVYFREQGNIYELLLKTICNIRSANSGMTLNIYTVNFDG